MTRTTGAEQNPSIELQSTVGGTQAAAAERKLSILSVDDQQANRVLIQALLTKGGHHVTLCSSAERALDHLAQRTFDVLLADLHLQTSAGFDLIRDVRALGHAVPIIVLTADRDEASWHQARQAGAALVLTKPDGYAGLLEAVEGIVSPGRDNSRK